MFRTGTVRIFVLCSMLLCAACRLSSDMPITRVNLRRDPSVPVTRWRILGPFSSLSDIHPTPRGSGVTSDGKEFPFFAQLRSRFRNHKNFVDQTVFANDAIIALTI